MKGLFIPEITTEMFRNGCLEGIEALMAEGEIYDIEYSPWIPIQSRPATNEEYSRFRERYGEDIPLEDCQSYCCRMPEDGQEVLITTTWGDVCIDTWAYDDGCGWFEDHEDLDDVIAWMPLPKPYKEEGESDADS